MPQAADPEPEAELAEERHSCTAPALIFPFHSYPQDDCSSLLLEDHIWSSQ